MTQNPTRRSLLKKLLLAAAILILLFLVALTALILPNQVRPVSIPPPLGEWPARPKIDDRPTTVAAQTLPTSGTIARLISTDPATTNTTETCRAAARRIADAFDDTGLSPAAREAFKKYKAELIDWLTACFLLPGATKDLPYQETLLHRRALWRNLEDLEVQLLGSYSSIDNSLLENRVNLYSLLLESEVRIALDHGEWGLAGYDSWILNDKDMDRVRYYCRKGGLKGRLLLTEITVGSFVDQKIMRPFRRWRQK